MDLNDLLPYLVGAPVLVAGAAAALLVRRRRGGDQRPDARPDATRTATDVVDRPVVPTPVVPPDVAVDGTSGAVEGATVEDISVEDLVAPPLETPAPTAGRLRRLRERLARSGSPLGTRLLSVLSRDQLTEDDWDELEETLLLADVGAGPTDEIMQALRTRVRVEGHSDPVQVRAVLREQLLALVDPSLDRSLRTAPVTTADGEPVPAVVLVVGVNGTGKTTTVGKLARVLVADGRTVVLGAADTFRAAAADQLETWGSRVGVRTVRSDRDGADPASVAFDALRTGRQERADVVLVDTAGRLQNKAGLMDELGKITRVLSRDVPLSEVLLVLDATTGQNGLQQARVFGEVAGVTGIVLTKLDGTARGGIVVAVQRELGVPVKLVGLGEGPDDLAPFDPEAFVDGLLGD
ncbi:signal recognition particle-docking protein FtsY [Cellulomonas sp. JZ18]|uniref:signal recognition particle-docking protein FtsY n=1 Tax=Cellulomonas sp. JZ18 TaxID=2654191 RepID=UPI0012D3FB44|nr:signal recognition particle-docking protein FtsY [Cellulomonas sp. JZ18]QGQ19685.1 signal recognition particle-docking protein FtsY [Cellulomonas sp. JZ18]